VVAVLAAGETAESIREGFTPDVPVAMTVIRERKRTENFASFMDKIALSCCEVFGGLPISLVFFMAKDELGHFGPLTGLC
jgi:hypothetical protein